ncbi:MAG TPA: ribonuclease E/G [Acetobacteraceae bacterium]|nr:ribonuclease E/G [Acetobacteraceae bacterium]
MSTRVLAICSPGEVRVAVVRDGEVVDYGLWRPGAPDGVGDVHRGRVTARMPAMAGAFIALTGSEGFLPDSAGAAGSGVGDMVTVRVTRAAQGGKGPRLTLVDGFAGDVGLLARGPGVLLEFAEREAHAPVVIDDAGLAARLKPVLGKRLSIAPAAWDEAIEEQVAALASPSIGLAGGARLHVEPTHALTAIDVDAGSAVASKQGKAAAHFAANLAVIGDVARQIRLRNLSGAILVDFAGLPARRREALGSALAAALAEDPLRPRLLGFTGLGLAEIVRPRVHPPLHEMLSGPHAAGLAALRQIVAEAAPHRAVSLRAAPDIVAALQSDGEALADLARRCGHPLMLRSNPGFRSDEWVIEARDG